MEFFFFRLFKVLKSDISFNSKAAYKQTHGSNLGNAWNMLWYISPIIQQTSMGKEASIKLSDGNQVNHRERPKKALIRLMMEADWAYSRRTNLLIINLNYFLNPIIASSSIIDESIFKQNKMASSLICH